MAQGFDNYYRLNGFTGPDDPSFSQKELDHRLKEAANKYHPDRNPENEEAKEIFTRYSVGYTTLSNPKEREAYNDLWREHKKTEPVDETQERIRILNEKVKIPEGDRYLLAAMATLLRDNHNKIDKITITGPEGNILWEVRLARGNTKYFLVDLALHNFENGEAIKLEPGIVSSLFGEDHLHSLFSSYVDGEFIPGIPTNLEGYVNSLGKLAEAVAHPEDFDTKPVEEALNAIRISLLDNKREGKPRSVEGITKGLIESRFGVSESTVHKEGKSPIA